jgi:hypothetical protein
MAIALSWKGHVCNVSPFLAARKGEQKEQLVQSIAISLVGLPAKALSMDS